MTKKLSHAFFGDKKFTEKVYYSAVHQGKLGQEDWAAIFQPYTSKLASIKSINNKISLYDIFLEFLEGTLEEFQDWQFQKLSSIVEISAHVFEHSFESWLSKQQSYRYFSEVVVRHSLFRPPHSVCIFNYDELNTITEWWLSHFHRYYDEYQKCASSSLNKILEAHGLPCQAYTDKDLKQAKLTDKQQILKFIN